MREPQITHYNKLGEDCYTWKLCIPYTWIIRHRGGFWMKVSLSWWLAKMPWAKIPPPKSLGSE